MSIRKPGFSMKLMTTRNCPDAWAIIFYLRHYTRGNPDEFPSVWIEVRCRGKCHEVVSKAPRLAVYVRFAEETWIHAGGMTADGAMAALSTVAAAYTRLNELKYDL